MVASPTREGISCGFVDPKRKCLDNEAYAPSSYDVTHNVTVIATYRLADARRTGINFKCATGRPYTPVTGAIYHLEYDVYEPLCGQENSVRYEDFRRLDIRLMHFRQMFGRYFTVFSLEAINILDINYLFGSLLSKINFCFAFFR
jgi:hypothetical protein